MLKVNYVDRPLVYVAAPYTRPDPVQNTHDLILAVNNIVDEGIVTPFAPHLTLLWHLVTPRSIDFWYEYDLAILARCDAVLRLPGDSTGADHEVEYAAACQIPIFYTTHDLYAWVATQHATR